MCERQSIWVSDILCDILCDTDLIDMMRRLKVIRLRHTVLILRTMRYRQVLSAIQHEHFATR